MTIQTQEYKQIRYVPLDNRLLGLINNIQCDIEDMINNYYILDIDFLYDIGVCLSEDIIEKNRQMALLLGIYI